MNESDAVTDPPPRMDLARYVPALLVFIANRLTSSGSASYRRLFGIGIVDFRVMAMLSIEPGASGARICDVIGLDKAAVSRALKTLEERGYVTALPGQARARTVTLTTAGEALYQRAWKVAQRRETRLLSLLSPTEQEILRGLLRKVLAGTALLSEPVSNEARPRHDQVVQPTSHPGRNGK